MLPVIIIEMEECRKRGRMKRERRGVGERKMENGGEDKGEEEGLYQLMIR